MCYFSNIFERPEATIETLSHEINNPKYGKVDLLVGIGVSGTAPLMALSIKTGIPFCVLRKTVEGTHATSMIETSMPYSDHTRFLIIDDIQESGKTINKIIAIMKEGWPDAVCAGAILYQGIMKQIPPVVFKFPVTCVYDDIVSVSEELKCQY
jgi:adenine/guanine phosphoribosyltransferase-like PRPP-binding protein